MCRRYSAALIAALASFTASAVAAPPIVTEALIPAPAAAVWKAYTERAELERWAVGTSSEIELTVGGQWRTSYERGSTLDDEHVIHNEVLALDPQRMLAVRTIKTPSDFPFPNAILKTWTVMYLEPVDASSTRVIVRMLGYTDDDESQRMRAFFERGNAFELRKLAEYLAQREPAAAPRSPPQ